MPNFVQLFLHDLKIGSTAGFLSMSKCEIFYFRGPWNLYSKIFNSEFFEF